jgi:hypothetical protein
MKSIFAIILLCLVAMVLKSCASDNKRENVGAKKGTDSTVNGYHNNDKIVVIKGAKYDDIKKAVQQFCNKYNEEKTVADIRLKKISEDEVTLTFPNDIEFKIFCFLVNYMYYPEDISYKADIKAWATTKPGDMWITNKSENKMVMLYIPKDDQEYDNVYLTTQDNIGYKLGFALGKECQLQSNPNENFISPSVSIESIKNMGAEEIK